MRNLFVHRNFPGQYLHLARHLAAQPGHQVVFVTQRTVNRHRSMLHVVQEGINTDTVLPDPQARLRLPGSEQHLVAGDEVVTYVARNLEPYRGFPSFMRSLPAILSARPQAQVLIIGGDEVSYGARGRPLLKPTTCSGSVCRGS